MHAQSFPPLIGPSVHTLILGTMPGQASLAAVEYYAHPRNALWPILHALISGEPASFDIHQSMDYASRSALIIEHGYALWDVLSNCERPGSLDSKIVRASEVPNDIASLVIKHPELRCIACNGRTAEALFNRHIKSTLHDDFFTLKKYNPDTEDNSNNAGNCDNIKSAAVDVEKRIQPLRIVSLPSTSPAMASLSLEKKVQRWADGLLG